MVVFVLREARHSVTTDALRRGPSRLIIIDDSTLAEEIEPEVSPNLARPPFARRHARNEKGRATPAPLHFQLMPDTGACGKPRVMPHKPRPQARNGRRGRIEKCTTNPHAVWP